MSALATLKNAYGTDQISDLDLIRRYGLEIGSFDDLIAIRQYLVFGRYERPTAHRVVSAKYITQSCTHPVTNLEYPSLKCSGLFFYFPQNFCNRNT